jgi:putative transcriptional regulator
MTTTVNHHPDTRLINEFAAGCLPLAQSACVSMHLNYCPHCARQMTSLQQVGATMFAELAPQEVNASALDDILSRLDEDPPLSFASVQPENDQLPGLMQRLMKGDYADLKWSRINSALQISRLRTGDTDNEFALYHIKAGGSIPQHTHSGSELTLVLEGSFSDEEGVYQPGDFLMRDADHIHTPTATQSTDCICIGVLDAPIRFTKWQHRPLNPFLRLQAH